MFFHRQAPADNLAEVAYLISRSRHLVALTGAGCSTESGIPDFRSPGGLWEKYDPAVYADYSSFLRDPSRFWEMSWELLPLLENARPNDAHLALAALERKGILKAVITQNIDGLHQKAGSLRVINLHGDYRTATCLTCGRDFSLPEIKRFRDRPCPLCPDCRGILKPKVVLFGEGLDPGVLGEATLEAARSDLMLAIGTGLEIYPASFLPSITKQKGGRLIRIDRKRLFPLRKSDLFLEGRAGEIMLKILSLINPG